MTPRHVLGAAAFLLLMSGTALASSHREAPFITRMPKVDATDVYAFRSYEEDAGGAFNRSGYVTLIANYYPLQDPQGGPNFFMLDPEALYEIHVDNNGDATEDLTFRFEFDMNLAGGANGVTLPIGGKDIAVPLINVGPITAADNSKLHVQETYTVRVVRGARRSGTGDALTRVDGGASTFAKPVDNIGEKSIADYNAYANAHIYSVNIPGCTPTSGNAKVFVGQRREPFAVNLGQIFDLINLNPLGAADQTNGGAGPARNDLSGKNVTTLALEVPKDCLLKAGATASVADQTIGVWTSASKRQAMVINAKAPSFNRPSREGGPWAQVSRLGQPLVNEVVIGLKDKDLFNAAHPTQDGALADYVTNPTLPALIEVLFPTEKAPTRFPRNDLVTVFLTGVPGVNQNGSTSEMLRLNVALPITKATSQLQSGAAGCFDRTQQVGTPSLAKLDTTLTSCDPAGFPNGRRPGDDVVDIALQVVMGALLPAAEAEDGHKAFTDGVPQTPATGFKQNFPYLNTPLKGSP